MFYWRYSGFIFNCLCVQGSILSIIAMVWFYGISTITGYLMPNPLYTYILSIWFGLVAYQSLKGYLMRNPVFTYISNMICQHFVDTHS